MTHARPPDGHTGDLGACYEIEEAVTAISDVVRNCGEQKRCCSSRTKPACAALDSAVLRNARYTVFEAANGDEALRLSKEHRHRVIDLLVTDVVMPQLGGKELARRLSAKRPEIKVLFMSGYLRDVLGDSDTNSRGHFLPSRSRPCSAPQSARNPRRHRVNAAAARRIWPPSLSNGVMTMGPHAVLLAALVLAGAPAYAQQARERMRDRGTGVPLSIFGTYIRSGELIVYPFGYGISENVAVEIEAAVMSASLEKSPHRTSGEAPGFTERLMPAVAVCRNRSGILSELR